LSTEERMRLAVADVARFVTLLAGPGTAVQFLDDSGHGKTTHLLALRALLPDAPYVLVPRTGSVTMPAGSPLLLDELQFLARRRRQRLYRRPLSLAVGTHVDLEDELRAAGFAVHTVRPSRHMTADRLALVLGRRIESVRRDDGPVPTLEAGAPAALLARFGADVRAIESHLYECFQRLREVQRVQV